MSIGPGHYAVLSAVVFALGVYGVIARRSALGVIAAIGLLFAAPVIALAGFAHLGQAGQAGRTPPLGDALAALAIVALCSEVALALAVVLLLWRRTDRAGEE